MLTRKSKLLIISSIIFLSACATTKQKSEPPVVTVFKPQIVEVPIPVPCKVEIPAEPKFNFNELDTEMDIFKKVQALLADRQLSIAYEQELVMALKACKD